MGSLSIGKNAKQVDCERHVRVAKAQSNTDTN